MRSPFKRLLSLCLCVVLVAVLIPAPQAKAEENDPTEHFTYTIKDGAVTITGRVAPFKEIEVIPDTIEGLPVTEIGDEAFDEATSLKQITLGKYVKTIGYRAFYGTSLTQITLDNNITTIGEQAFCFCTSLTQITLGDSVTTIGESAFFRSSLTKIIIPTSVKRIDKQALDGITTLKTVVFLGDPPEFHKHAFGLLDRYPTLDDNYFDWFDKSRFNATLYYPMHNPNWTSGVMLRYGGWSDTWIGIHSRDEGTLITPATCTTDGSRSYTCTVCGEIETETIPAGHSWVITSITPATCTAGGRSIYVCTGCSETKEEAIPALGHAWGVGDGKITTQPTCTEPGEKVYTCKTCGEIVARYTLSATGHNWNNGTITTQPTCTEPGIRFHTCMVCSDTREQRISATGHTSDDGTITVPATCTEPGQKVYTCTTCGEVFKTETLPATGHQYQQGIWLTQPGCETTGEKSYTCGTCGYIKYVTWPANGHSAVTDPAVPATCTVTGLTEGQHCENCDKVLTPQKPIPTIGHSYRTEVRNPTCTENGTITNTCTVCGDIVIGTIPATGHQYETGTCIHCGITLTGDLTGDNTVDIADVARLYAHIRNTAPLKEPHLQNADTTGDGTVDIADVAKLYAHTKGTASLP